MVQDGDNAPLLLRRAIARCHTDSTVRHKGFQTHADPWQRNMSQSCRGDPKFATRFYGAIGASKRAHGIIKTRTVAMFDLIARAFDRSCRWGACKVSSCEERK